MSRALECPNCGSRQSLDAVAPGSTFDCTGCGRTLRAPAAATAPVEPVPTAAMGSSAPTGSRAQRRRESSGAGGPEAGGGAADGFPVAVRIGAWVVAVVAGGLLSIWVARGIGLLTADRIVDVITGSGSGRYLRLGVFMLLWALMATVLVTLLIDGGWRLLHRAAASPARGPVAAATTAATEGAAAPPRQGAAAGMPARSTDQRPRRIPPRDTGA